MSNTASQMVMVDITKLGQGLKSVFTGCAMVFDSLGVGGAASLISGVSDTAKNQVEQMADPQQEAKQEPTEKPAAENLDEDEPPFDTEPAAQAVRHLQRASSMLWMRTRMFSAAMRNLWIS